MTPASFQPDGPSLRWGILGTGGIAEAFAKDLRLLDGADVTAVGSRRQETADAFADRLGVSGRHASYAALVSDDNVDAVYVATPHPMHHDAALLAIEAGKAVLCEKPFTLNAAEARSLADAARAHGVFLMEAMWTRFLPHMVKLRELLADGVLGDVRLLMADHGQFFPENAEHRIYAPRLGGGALLDLGVYPFSFASMVLGTPARVLAVSDRAFTGVDAQTSAVLQYDSGAHALVTSTLEARTPTRASVSGTEAQVRIDGGWYTPTDLTVVTRDGDVEEITFAHEGHGLRHQAGEVARCIAEGLTESPILPPGETVRVMETMDEVRRQIGLRYDMESDDALSGG